LLTGLAGILLWRISRRLWPDDGKTQLVVLACFAGSSQVVLTATTTFAMSTHLALNLLWLACFLRGTRLGHAGAIATGFLATGIHQIAFHPLFVLPFLELLARRRQWSTLACYLVGYAAIGLFWAEWPHWLMSQILPHPVPGSTAAAAEVGLFNRIAGMIGPLSRDAILVMGCNVLRFVTWQHLLLVPLALVGVRKCVGSDDVARALAQGVVLLLLVLLILIPPQGHGWGYRYLHGLIGSCCLLAGYGWRWLAARDGAPVRAMQVATLASVLVLIPVHLWMARGMLAPTAEAKAAIARTGADIAVVETGLIPFGSNLVINRPDLSNRPLLLESGMVTPANLAALCRGRSVTFVDANRFDDVVQYYGARPLTAVGPHQLLLRQAAADAGCRQIAFVR